MSSTDRRANFQTGLEGRPGLWNLARWDSVSDVSILGLISKSDARFPEFIQLRVKGGIFEEPAEADSDQSVYR